MAALYIEYLMTMYWRDPTPWRRNKVLWEAGRIPSSVQICIRMALCAPEVGGRAGKACEV